MQSLSELIKIEHKNEHRYTTPKIYDCGGKVHSGCRWFVYYRYLDPNTNRLKRQNNVYLGVNRLKTESERREYINKVRDKLEELLSKGWSPYFDSIDNDVSTISESFQFVLNLKNKIVKPTTYKDYKSRVNRFKEYLDDKGYSELSEINRKVCNAYLNHVLKTSSARNVNNTRIVLSALFSSLEQNDMVKTNYFHGIKNLSTTPTKHKIYTDAEVEIIFKHLDNTELLLFIKFVSYMWLRPIEVCRIKKENIDTKEMTLTIQTKTGLKSKVLPIIIRRYAVAAIQECKDFLFSHQRDYYTKQFGKIKKELNLHKNHTIYSFRHYYTVKVYRELRKKYSKTETLDKLMLITGHRSLSGLMNYLRNLDAELPDDYSEMLK